VLTLYSCFVPFYIWLTITHNPGISGGRLCSPAITGSDVRKPTRPEARQSLSDSTQCSTLSSGPWSWQIDTCEEPSSVVERRTPCKSGKSLALYSLVYLLHYSSIYFVMILVPVLGLLSAERPSDCGGKGGFPSYSLQSPLTASPIVLTHNVRKCGCARSLRRAQPIFWSQWVKAKRLRGRSSGCGGFGSSEIEV